MYFSNQDLILLSIYEYSPRNLLSSTKNKSQVPVYFFLKEPLSVLCIIFLIKMCILKLKYHTNG
jgi:hypothetical protein